MHRPTPRACRRGKHPRSLSRIMNSISFQLGTQPLGQMHTPQNPPWHWQGTSVARHKITSERKNRTLHRLPQSLHMMPLYCPIRRQHDESQGGADGTLPAAHLMVGLGAENALRDNRKRLRGRPWGRNSGSYSGSMHVMRRFWEQNGKTSRLYTIPLSFLAESSGAWPGLADTVQECNVGHSQNTL